MTPSVASNHRYIVIRSRGILEFLSFGLWSRTTTIDFHKQSLTVQTRRFWRRWAI